MVCPTLFPGLGCRGIQEHSGCSGQGARRILPELGRSLPFVVSVGRVLTTHDQPFTMLMCIGVCKMLKRDQRNGACGTPDHIKRPSLPLVAVSVEVIQSKTLLDPGAVFQIGAAAVMALRVLGLRPADICFASEERVNSSCHVHRSHGVFPL